MPGRPSLRTNGVAYPAGKGGGPLARLAGGPHSFPASWPSSSASLAVGGGWGDSSSSRCARLCEALTGRVQATRVVLTGERRQTDRVPWEAASECPPEPAPGPQNLGTETVSEEREGGCGGNAVSPRPVGGIWVTVDADLFAYAFSPTPVKADTQPSALRNKHTGSKDDLTLSNDNGFLF